MFKSVIFTCVLLVVAASATSFTDCGSTGELKSLRVDGCVTPPCRVKRGTTLHIAFDFVPKTDSDDIASKLTGKFSGVEAPWPGKLPEGCDMLTTGECPLEAGVPATAELDLPISLLFPPIKATAHWEFDDDNGDKIICFEVPLILS